MTNSTRAALLSEIESLTRCPVDWDVEERFEDTADLLRWEWLEVYRYHQADRESAWIDDPYAASIVDPDNETVDELRAAASNLRLHVPAAAAEYTKRTRRFWALRVADPDVHEKHYPPGGTPWATLVARTGTSGKSLLKPGIGPGQLLEAYWALLSDLAVYRDGTLREELRSRIFSNDVVRLALSSFQPIGACYGHESNALCFELDASTPLLHAYPLTEQEADEIRAGFPTTIIDDLDGFDEIGMRRFDQRPFGKPYRP